MTEPNEATAADPGLKVQPEVIEDLDVTGDDADNIAGGCVGVSYIPYTFKDTL